MNEAVTTRDYILIGVAFLGYGVVSWWLNGGGDAVTAWFHRPIIGLDPERLNLAKARVKQLVAAEHDPSVDPDA